MENIFFVNTTQFVGAVDKLDIIKATNMVVEAHATGVNVSGKGPDGDLVSIECGAAEVMNKEIIDIPVTKTLKAALKKFGTHSFTNLQLFDGTAALDDNKKVIKSKYQQAESLKDHTTPAADTIITESAKISYEELKRVYDKLKKFVSSDKTKPVLNAIYFNGTEAAAVDGYKLGTVKTYADFKGGLQIHINFIERILKLYKGIQDDLTITWRDNNIFIAGEVKCQQVNYKFEWLQADFIDYKKFFTPDYDLNYFNMDKKEILDAVEYVHAAAAGTNNSLMTIEAINNNNLTLIAKNAENVLSENIKADHNLDIGYKIAFNSLYLQDTLKTMFKDSSTIKAAVKRNTDPITIKDDETGVKCIILPVRLRD